MPEMLARLHSAERYAQCQFFRKDYYMAAKEKYRMLKAGEVILPTDEVYVRAPINKWLCGSLNCGKKLPAKYEGGYRRLDIMEGKTDTDHNTGSQKLLNSLKSALPLVKNGMSSKEIHNVRGVIADAIDQLRASA